MQHTKKIFVTFQKEGIHRYPAAATIPELEPVKWLANDHRHMFHFKVTIEVFHDDRDLEFILVKRWLEGLYGNGTIQLDHKSCEMLAADLYWHINNRYPNRDVEIEVSEDGENGAIMTWTKN